MKQMRVKIASLTKPPTEFADKLYHKASEKSARYYQTRSTQDCTELGADGKQIAWLSMRWYTKNTTTHCKQKDSCCLELNTKLKIPSKTYVMYLHLSYCKSIIVSPLLESWRTMLKTAGGTALSPEGAAVPEGNVFNMVRQHTKLSSETSIRGRTLASNDDFLTFHKSALMRRTSCSDFLALKSIEFNETLHVARYDKYLCIYFTFFKSNRRIKRYQTKKVKKKYKITKPSRRQSHLHRYVQLAVNRQPGYRQEDS